MLVAEILGPKLQPDTRAILAQRSNAVEKLFSDQSHYVIVTAQFSAAEGR